MLLIALTEADSTLNLRSLQIDSAECRLLKGGRQGVPVAVNQVMEHNTARVLVPDHKQRRALSSSLNMHWVVKDHNSYKKEISVT